MELFSPMGPKGEGDNHPLILYCTEMSSPHIYPTHFAQGIRIPPHPFPISWIKEKSGKRTRYYPSCVAAECPLTEKNEPDGRSNKNTLSRHTKG